MRVDPVPFVRFLESDRDPLFWIGLEGVPVLEQFELETIAVFYFLFTFFRFAKRIFKS